MIKTIQVIIPFLLFSSSISVAGTIIEIKNKNEIITVLTDGEQVRINTGGSDYIVVDYKNNRVKTVDTKNHQAMLVDMDNMPKMGNAAKIQTAIKYLGAGPFIAGYKTQRFAYTVNGKACGVIYGSKDAYQHKGIKVLFNAMTIMMKKQQAMLGGFASMLDACTLGDMVMSNHVAAIGVPMRTEKKGMVDIEVKNIKLDVALPANLFVVPASYKTVGIKDEVQKSMAKIQRHVSQNPQLQPQVQKMVRQSGNMPPEAMERIRRAQQQMRQYQQPGY